MAFRSYEGREGKIRGAVRMNRIAGLLCRGIHADFASRIASFEFHQSGDFGEEGMVLAHPNVMAGMKFGASLANENVARLNQLVGVSFHAKVLRIAVASVSG